MDEEFYSDGAASFGENAHEAAELMKAMTGGELPAEGAQIAGDSGPITPQDLEGDLKVQTFKMQHLKLWPRLNGRKGTAVALVHEHSRLHEYGSAEDFIAHDMGGLPVEDDSTYSRELLRMKFLGNTRRIPLPVALQKSIAGAHIVRENTNAMMLMLKGIEKLLYEGDSSVNPRQFDGIRKLIIDGGGTVVDAAGGLVTEDLLLEATTRITDEPNYGMPGLIHATPLAVTDISRLFKDRMRKHLGDDSNPNYAVRKWAFQHGDMAIEQNTFLRPRKAPPNDGNGYGPVAAKRPLQPAIVTQPAHDGSGYTKWTAAWAGGGNYIYKVALVNQYGEGPAVTTNAVAVGTEKRVVIVINDIGVGDQKATGIKVYRSTRGGAASTCKEIFRQPIVGTGNQTISDVNEWIPGTSDIYLLEDMDESLSWKQFLPFTQWPLGKLDTSYRWTLLMYGALQSGAPRHNGLIKNVALGTSVAP